MNYKVFLLSLLYCFSTYGQENNKSKSGLSDAELSYAVEEYAKMTKTATWMDYHKVTIKFTEGMGETLLVARPEYADKEKLKLWIKQNLSMTKFKSIEEAISLVDELDAHSSKVHEENKKLHELIPKATSTQLMKIWQPLADLAMQKK
jgi:hypothetical protein